MSRAEQAAGFCSALFGGLVDDDRLTGLYVPLWSDADKLTRWRPADKPGAVASLIAELDEQPGAGNIYVGVGLLDAPRGKVVRTDSAGEPVTAGRTLNESVTGLFGLWADIDIAGEGHADAHYPPDVDAARKVLDAVGLTPTLIVHTGGGLHVWWLFGEPWLIREADDPEREHARMTALAADWVLTVRYRAEMLGRYKIDSVRDLARLLRPAGTTNRKITDNPRRVEILEHNPSAVYEPADFEARLPDPAVLKGYANPVNTIQGLALTEAEAEIVRQVNFAAVWARANSPEYRAVDYTPAWLADILELEAEANGGKVGEVGKIWFDKRPDFKDDQNRFDAALVKTLSGFSVVDAEGLVEAVMCRRLRLPDSAKADKVDPRRRMNYVARTVARFRVKAAHLEQLQTEVTDAIEEAAAATLPLPGPPPAPDLDVEVDHRGRVADQDQAEEAFGEFTSGLLDRVPPSAEETARAADDLVVAEHTGEPVPPPSREAAGQDADAIDDAPGGGDPDEDDAEEEDQRSEQEVKALGTLTDLLIPPAYRKRGIRVERIEYSDYGERQRGRLLLRLPVDFDWPADRPTRYRPGRLLPTEWWSRSAFDTPKGFRLAVERDCKIVTREDGPKEDWAALLRRLVPLWRRDSSGSDLAHFAHEWLYGYLMLHHGTGQPAEVGSTGRPWVRKTNGWRSDRPPVILLDLSRFLDHCRRQPGAVQGRATAGVVDFLKLTRRRVPLKAPGMPARPTLYEIDRDQFNTSEWAVIIETTRGSYERSMEGRPLRAVGSGGDEGRAHPSGGLMRAAR